MTNQEKKAILGRYRAAVAEADRLELEIREWRARAEHTTAAASELPEECGGRRSLEDAVIAMDGIASELAEKRMESCRLRMWLEEQINAVDEERLRELLRRRYIDGSTWEEISEAMEMSYQWICNLHGVALNALPLDRN